MVQMNRVGSDPLELQFSARFPQDPVMGEFSLLSNYVLRDLLLLPIILND